MATPIDPNDPALQPLIPPTLPLAGKKALLVGIANKDSIAYRCARAFRAFGAEVAMTYRSEKTRTYTQPLAEALQVPPELFLPCEVREPDHIEAVFDCYGLRPQVVPSGEGPLTCLCAFQSYVLISPLS